MRIATLISGWAPGELLLNRPYIIAEAGVNHEGDISMAKQLVGQAAQAGADAIKFQTYRASTLASVQSPAYWDTSKETAKSQFELFQRYDKFWKKEYEELKNCCDQENIEFLSTPFDNNSALFLNDLMEVFKISSSDITNKPFIEALCRYGKPLILSTGASNLEEIDAALQWIDEFNVPAAILHCVLNYPTNDEDANLGMILGLKENYPKRMVGYSDHTLPRDMKTLEMATLLGAEILEKHFTHNKNLPGNDHYHAMDKDDLVAFRRNLDRLLILRGERNKRALDIEGLARENARRSLVASRPIPAGAKISNKDLTWKRPAHGISPKSIDKVIGRQTRRSIAEDELLTWDMLK